MRINHTASLLAIGLAAPTQCEPLKFNRVSTISMGSRSPMSYLSKAIPSVWDY